MCAYAWRLRSQLTNKAMGTYESPRELKMVLSRVNKSRRWGVVVFQETTQDAS
jgi:uncharacterized Fe-S cluster-containing radical SAM superfamily protein